MLRILLSICFVFVHLIIIGQTITPYTKLITNAEQLSSPFTHVKEGVSFENLLDGNPSSYWHSYYNTSISSKVHWIEVKLNTSINGYVCIYMHRRLQSSKDHPTRFQITASKDGLNWNEVGIVDMPFEGKGVAYSDAFYLNEKYLYIRVSALDCYPSFRTYWHVAEMQLYYIGNTNPQEISADSLRINEIQTTNIDQFIDPSFNYGSWIEIYNIGSTPVFLNDIVVKHTDSDGEIKQYTLGYAYKFLAPHTHLVLWFDHHYLEGNYGFNSHVNIPFKLDVEGGNIELINSDGNVIDSVTYPLLVSRCSYARCIDGKDKWAITSNPTPNRTNNDACFATNRLLAPIISQESTVFKGEQLSFSVEIPKGTSLRYTTDGSTPTSEHGCIATDGYFTVKETTIYRFVLVAEDKLPSKVVTRSFIKADNNYYLPILSISTHPDNLFSDTIGLYTKGTNGISGNGISTPCNWNMDWERPINIEYLIPEDETYKMVLNQECEFKIAGNYSRPLGGDKNWEAKPSFNLKSGKLYERLNSFDYPVFNSSKPFNKYKVLKVRNGGNDAKVRMTDAVYHEIFRRSGFNVNCQAWQPSHVFINGKYLGMLNLRETNNKNYAESEYGIDTDDVDQFELNGAKGYEQKEGTNESFKSWLERTKIVAKNPENEESWLSVCEIVDVDQFCNYMAAEIYMGSGDWITNNNNIKGFASRNPNGKFRLMMLDLDAAFAYTDMLHLIHGLLSKNDSRYADNNGVNYLVEIFFNMLEYEPFQKQFIDAYCIVAGSVFNPSYCKNVIDDIALYIAPALKLEEQSPQTKATQIYSKIADPVARTARMQTLQDFF